jgi:hypothetical protein
MNKGIWRAVEYVLITAGLCLGILFIVLIIQGV